MWAIICWILARDVSLSWTVAFHRHNKVCRQQSRATLNAPGDRRELNSTCEINGASDEGHNKKDEEALISIVVAIVSTCSA